MGVPPVSVMAEPVLLLVFHRSGSRSHREN